MAKSNGTAPAVPDQLSVKAISDDLHDIAARLAGLESVLRRISNDGDAELGNALHLMSEVAAQANHQICLCADRVSDFMKLEVAQ